MPLRYDQREIAAAWTDVFGLHDKQRRFVEASRPFGLFVGGAGAGKTRVLLNCAMRFATQSPPKVRIGVFGRTGPDITHTLRPTWAELEQEWLDAFGFPFIASVNNVTGEMLTAFGNTIVWRPYDRIDKVRGLNLGAACVDEIEHAQPDARYALQVFMGRVRDQRGPQKLRIATTPNGMQGAVAEFVRHQRVELRLTSEARDRELEACDDPGGPNGCRVCESCELSKARKFVTIHATLWDNTFLDADTKAQMVAGLSKRMFKQEAEGKILRPTDTVFSEYRESDDEDGPSHLVRYRWRADLPYMLGIDWGTTRGYWCAVQYDPQDPSGAWVVAHESVLEDVSRVEMRADIDAFVKRQGRHPTFIAFDRAVKSENEWARRRFVGSMLRGMESRDEQNVTAGVETIRFMLDPNDGPPRLYLSSDLHSDLTTDEGRGLRDSLAMYGYQRIAGELTNIPSRSPTDPSKHAVDALRYLVVATMRLGEFHGGRPLPFVDVEALRHPEREAMPRRYAETSGRAW